MKAKLPHLLAAVALAVCSGLVVAVLSVSAAPTRISALPGLNDDFDSPTLGDRWSWLREDATHWSLTDRPGFLRITTQQGGLFQTPNNAKNLLLQAAPVGDFEIQTRIIFTPTANIQSAGLIIYQDDDNYLALMRAFCGFGAPCAGDAIYFDREEQGQLPGGNFATVTTPSDEIYLRLARRNTVYTGYFSANGTDWVKLGSHIVVHGLVPAKVGLFAYNGTFDAPEILADFDFFRLDDKPYRVMLPLVLK